MAEVLDTAEVGRPRRDRDEPRLFDTDLVDQLIADAREQGVDVAGEGGLFAQLAKTVKTRGHFPNDDALIKLLYLGCRELGRADIRGRGGRSNYNWKIALNQFDIMFPGRLDKA